MKYGQIILEKTEDGYVVSSCECDAVEAVIPAAVDGRPVVGIGERAFAGCVGLSRVVFPSLEELYAADVFSFDIGEHAFDGCISLSKIELPSVIGAIGRGAFYNCRTLLCADIPDCYVGPYAFYGCEMLTSVSPISTISEGVFSHCKSLASLPASASVQVICEDAFYHCYSLTDIRIPASVTAIEPLAFRSCYNLKSVIFDAPDGWFERNSCKEEKIPLDLSSPMKNAEILSKMDFDDGVIGWYKQS